MRERNSQSIANSQNHFRDKFILKDARITNLCLISVFLVLSFFRFRNIPL